MDAASIPAPLHGLSLYPDAELLTVPWHGFHADPEAMAVKLARMGLGPFAERQTDLPKAAP